jgi:antitoxin component of RelBE/YafQ-DinJ toxin-antitoxin module
MSNLNLREIPEDLRNAFKAACAEQGKTMTEVIVAFMRATVKKARIGK